MSQTYDPRNGLRRLLAEVESIDTLKCEEAENQLPNLVTAEARGENVENNSAYTPLLLHLDQCESCLALYEDLSQSIDEFFAPNKPVIVPPAPSILIDIPQAQGVTVRLLSRMQRVFEIALGGARRQAAVPVMGNQQLFVGTIDQVAGEPLISISRQTAKDSQMVQVVVRSIPGERWDITLTTNDIKREIRSDEQGVAYFSGISEGELTDITVRCCPVLSPQASMPTQSS